MMGRYGYGYDMMGGYGGFGALMMFFLGALILAGIVLLILWAVRAGSHHGTGGTAGTAPLPPGAVGHDEAVAIAKRRLASGEITAEQYGEIIRALGGV